MEDKIKQFVINSLAETPKQVADSLSGVKFRRFFVDELTESLRKSGQRIHIVAGLRGTGKTTALYQLFAETDHESIAYFSCDELLSREIGLEDAILALDQVKKETVGVGKPFLLLLDEVSYLPKWDLWLKILRDKRAKLSIVATASSSLALRKTNEFARRAVEISALPLSFREYLALKHSIKLPSELASSIRDKLGRESLDGEYIKVVAALGNRNLHGLYEEYMGHDMPFAFGLGDRAYMDALVQSVKRTIYEDFPKYANLDAKALLATEILVKYLSTVPADGVTLTKLSEVVGISKESVVKLLGILELAMVIKGLECHGRNRRFKNPKKWFFYSSSMRRALAAPVSSESDMSGNSREDSVFRHLISLYPEVFYSHDADFIADVLRFEVGGKGKRNREGCVILSMDERISKDRIPLALFALSV